MNELTNTSVQIITQHGRPAFAVLPYSEFLALTGQESDQNDVYIPHEVVELHLVKGFSLVTAWRHYKNYTQSELAEKLGISQATYARMEKSRRPRKSTLKRIATALNISPYQLSLD